MNNEQLTYDTVDISMEEGDSIKNNEFPTISGKILGFMTTVVGDRPSGKRANITLKMNGNDIHRPIDLNFTETKGRAGFKNGLLPLHLENPGRITAQVNMDAAVANGEDFKVQVLVVSQVKC